MFYSHEILTSRRHGVATIWLVATAAPRSATHKVNRKAIQAVDVVRACETIMEPGAPIALRLQGSLLYGVSRVFSQQCNYVLTDAEKVQHDMKLFYRILGSNATDPQAGKARREQNIIEDDPSFVLETKLPQFDFFDEGNFSPWEDRISSRSEYSHLTPVKGSSSIDNRSGSLMEINISQSDKSSLQLLSPFGPPSSRKNFLAEQIGLDVNPAEERSDFDALADLQLDMREDGTIVGIIENPFDEPELPPHPANADSGRLPAESSNSRHKMSLRTEPELQNTQSIIEEQGEMPIFGDEEMPRLEVQPRNDRQSILSDGPRQASGHAAGRKLRTISPDNPTQLHRRTISAWRDDYVKNAETLHHDRQKLTLAEARINAKSIVIGQGLGGIGRQNAIANFEFPLAEYFAGSALRDRIFGRPLSADGSDTEYPLRRSASEAFEDDEREKGRRVRPRLGVATPQPREHQDLQYDDNGLGVLFGDDEQAPEVGREEHEAMEERMSSSIMPWNHTPSVRLTPSMIGSKQKQSGGRRPAGSPKGSMRSAERYSDVAVEVPTSDPGFAALRSMDSSLNDLGAVPNVNVPEGPDSQWMHSALDIASQEFLDYAKEQAAEVGGVLKDDKESRLWIEFEDLALPERHSKVVAAQAFYHTLTLATKNVIRVEQDADNSDPFGIIHIGVDMDSETETRN